MCDLESKRFVKSFLRFLNSQIDDGKLNAESAESIEVAVQCLQTVYGLDQESEEVADDFDLYELYRGALLNVSPESKEEAENLKNEGNKLMKEEKYHEALLAYNRAISRDATNAVYYCNRAAAHSRLGDYQRAADDCKMSLKYDPKYGKAYGRLGLAYSKLEKYQESIDAYTRALEIEPDNQDYQNNISVAREKLQKSQTNPSGSRGGAGSAGGGGGFPGALGNMDIAAALSNPALVQMASRMMSDPGMQNLMGQLGNFNDVDSLIETGRNLAQQLSAQNPDLIESIRRQMHGPDGGNEDGPQNPPGN